MLLRGVIHVVPGISEAVSAALQRFMDDGLKLHIEYPPLLSLWVDVVETWIQATIKGGLDSHPDIDQLVAKCSEIEAASLFLLSHGTPKIYTSGVRVIRVLGSIARPISSATNHTFFLVEKMVAGGSKLSYLEGYDELLDKTELSRLDQWRKFPGMKSPCASPTVHRTKIANSGGMPTPRSCVIALNMQTLPFFFTRRYHRRGVEISPFHIPPCRLEQ